MSKKNTGNVGAGVGEETSKVKGNKVVRFEDIDTSLMVNVEKAKRAFKGVFGGAKGGSNEITLAGQLRAENPKLVGAKLVLEVYKGLGGLVDAKKAAVNRKSEAKTKAAKASR